MKSIFIYGLFLRFSVSVVLRIRTYTLVDTPLRTLIRDSLVKDTL